MKKTVFFVLTLSLIVLGTFPSEADQTIRIENHSFGVITEDQIYSKSDQRERLALYISNKDCIARYAVVMGGIVIGEGEIDCKRLPQTIPFGKINLYILCQADHLTITLR